MDFSPDEPQEDLRALAAEVLDREDDPARLRRALADTGIAAAKQGAVGAALVLREAAARASPAPLLPALALDPLVDPADTAAPATAPVPASGPLGVRARPDGDGALRVDGAAAGVPHADEAHTLLLPVDTPDGPAVARVPAGAAGLTLAPQHTGCHIPAFRAGLDGVRLAAGDLLTGGAVRTLHLCTLTALTATAAGALRAALDLTCEHVRTRHQFGRPLAQMQAVTMRVADVSIASRSLDAALLAGAWRLDRGDPNAAPVLESAALLATEDALDALHAAQHLHGGLGVDTSYPLHRHFATAKWVSAALGGPEARLEALGDLALA
ncbi:acyl-CoA dehydrogenase family protein [Nocardiopsis sp. RSe5-2]|uniref:Acyl-CoA dehydrogenase family protein n=1 Tax=Nocardiopsis endophytica TaxID=3018445 RepID=A0ABT4U3D1_9ACTN|nr:acyl-CoA dehydrogenase family protein [Nocardiopsis endophytica]MDA2811466.1 acyl-CoA dehydrogenase family protein [Nocardiopsis endophytica]